MISPSSLVDKLEANGTLSRSEFTCLIEGRTPEVSEYLFQKARSVRHAIYGKDIFLRGLIEFTNYCKNDCLYCGIRKSNLEADRYRLSQDDILDCCAQGYELGFRTFVLQGGEDPYFTDDRMVAIVKAIRASYPDCADRKSVV